MSIARRTLQVLAFTCTLLVGATAMAVIVTQTTWFKEWMRSFIVQQAAGYVNGDLSIGRLDGNLLFGVELENIGVTMDGKTVVDIKDVGLDYNAFTFLLGHVVLDDIRLNQPVFHLEKTDGEWNLTRLIIAQTPDEPRRRRPIEIGEIGISDATLYVEDRPVGTSGVVVPTRIGRLDASIGVRSDEDAMTIDIPDPWAALDTAFASLKVGGILVAYSPTVPQVMDFSTAVRKHPGFLFLRTIEIIEREWESEERKVRPLTQQIGHSGFLSFARKVRS